MIDIKAAFLQDETFRRKVFLRPPKEAGNTRGQLWKLNKCVYGFSDALKVWYFSVRSVLLKTGCVQLKADSTMFYWKAQGKLAGIFMMHVDDFLWVAQKKKG